MKQNTDFMSVLMLAVKTLEACLKLAASVASGCDILVFPVQKKHDLHLKKLVTSPAFNRMEARCGAKPSIISSD